MAEQEQSGTANAGVGQASSASPPKKRGKLFLFGGLGCAALLACCCPMTALSSWLDRRDRRAAYGPPAIARAFAERALSKAAEDEQNIQRSTATNPIEREHDEVSAAAFRDLAARIQARAETLQDQDVTDALFTEIARADKTVCDRLRVMLAAVEPERTETREWLTWRIQSRPSPREEIARWVDDTRRDLERKYEAERRGRPGATAGPDGRIDPGPQTGPAQAGASGAVEASVRLVRFNDLSESLRIKNRNTFAWRTRRVVLNGTYVTERAVAIGAGQSSDMTWSLNNFRDAQGRAFGPMNVRGISSITIETDAGVWEGALD